MYEKSGVRVEDSVIKYRIGVINDFQNSFSFIDFKQYGIMKIWGAGKFSNQHKGYQVAEDSIYVFLNYEKVGTFKNKQEAQKLINQLIKDSPVSLEEFQEYLKV